MRSTDTTVVEPMPFGRAASFVSDLTDVSYQQDTSIHEITDATLRSFPVRSSYLPRRPLQGIEEENVQDHVMETPRRLSLMEAPPEERKGLLSLCLSLCQTLSSYCSMMSVFSTSQTPIMPVLTGHNTMDSNPP